SGGHPLPPRRRGGRELTPAGGGDDRGPGTDERFDRADRSPREGAHALERPAPQARGASSKARRTARAEADARAHPGDRAHPRWAHLTLATTGPPARSTSRVQKLGICAER